MKLKRLFTAALSAALALSLCAMPAMAVDGAAADVWTQNSGSITIHKYEYNGTDAKKSTGETADEGNLPTDARPLAGAEFSIYRVMERTQLRAYYDGLSTDEPVKVEDYLNPAGDAIKSGESYSTAVDKKTTDADGLATFDRLALGLYVVVETATPDKVTRPVKPFLVSVPMTKASTRSEWLYDIHVYPKNGTAYGKVDILKTARIGDGAASPLKGVTFTLEKFNTTTNTWNPVTTSESNNIPFNLTTNESGIVSVSGLSQGKYHFIEQSIEGNNTYIIDQTPIEFVVTNEGKIEYNGGPAAAAIEIPVVNEGTAIEKQIDKNGTLTNHTDYSVGDHVPYQITVTVPQNIAKLKTFTVTDTPTNLKFDGTASNFSVQCNGTDVDATAYTVTPVNNGFTIAFFPDKMAAYVGEDIIIKYTATLQATAVQTTAGNTNAASLEYTNKIGVDPAGNPTEVGKKETKDEAVVYTFKVKVYKTADDTKRALAGVEFDLYKEDANGTVAGNDAKALGLDDTKKWTKINTTAPLVSGSDGYLEQNGLANGNYYLVETKTAEGYNLLKSPVEVPLNIQETTTFTKAYDEAGNMTITKTTKFNGGDAANSGEYTVNVVNRKGFTLPVTGGFGTLLFSGIGLLLVLVGVSVLFSLKKKTNRA